MAGTALPHKGYSYRTFFHYRILYKLLSLYRCIHKVYRYIVTQSLQVVYYYPYSGTIVIGLKALVLGNCFNYTYTKSTSSPSLPIFTNKQCSMATIVIKV